MGMFKKKPVVIEAIQWQGFNKQIVIKEVSPYDPYGEIKDKVCEHCGLPFCEHGNISTLEDGLNDGHVVCPNDWIITGVKGEKYPCKPDIFEATYERVE